MPAQIVHDCTGSVVIEKRRLDRYLGLVIGSIFSAMTAVLFLFAPSSSQTPTMTNLTSLCIVGSLIILLIGIAMAGPCELRLDTHTRKYMLQRGLPFVANRLHGPIEEIAYLAVREVHGKNGPAIMFYQIELEWKRTDRRKVMLRYARMEEAYRIRDEIQAKFGIPVRWEA